MQDAIVIKPFVADQVKNAMIHGRVIFFSAPCGFGKTTTAWALLEGKKVYFAAAGEPGFRLPLLRETLEEKQIPMAAAEVTMIPQSYVELTDEQDLYHINKLLSLLEEDDDVQEVYHNWDE